MYAFTSLPKKTIKSLFFYASDCLILVFLFTTIFYYRESLRRLLFKGERKILAFFVGSVFLSSFLSSYALSYHRSLHLYNWVLVWILYCLVQEAVQKYGLKPILKLFCALVFSLAVFESVVAISQYFIQGEVGLRFLGEEKLSSTGGAIIPIDHFSYSIFDYYLFKAQGNVLMRVYGTFGHPNELGGFLAFSLPLTFGYYLLNNRKSVVLWGIPFQICALFLTFSRSALISAVLGSVVFFILLRKNQIRKLLAVFVLTFMAIFITFLPQVISRGGVVNYPEFAKQSDVPRVQSLLVSWELIKQNYLVGVGNKCYMKASRTIDRDAIRVHNIYALTAVELGLTGFSIFALLIFSGLKEAYSRREDMIYITIVSAFITMLTVGLFDYYPVTFHLSKYFFFIFLALLTAEKRSHLVSVPSLQA